jgi:hypothetical protein
LCPAQLMNIFKPKDQQNPAGTAAFCGEATNISNVDINKSDVTSPFSNFPFFLRYTTPDLAG